MFYLDLCSLSADYCSFHIKVLNKFCYIFTKVFFVSGVMILISNSICSLLGYRKTIGFCILALCPIDLAIIAVSLGRFIVDSLRVST